MDSQKRILLLLKKLNRGEIIDIKNDELWINEKDSTNQSPRLSDKTIKRDFDLIKEVFDELEIVRVENGHFSATNTKILSGLMDKNERTALKIIYAMLEQNSLKLRKNLGKTEVENIVNETFDSYKFITKPIEMRLDNDIIESLEKAIKFRNKLSIDYAPTDGGEKNEL